MPNSRRKALQTLAAAAVAVPLAGQHEHGPAQLVQVAAAPAKTAPKYFSAQQLEALATLTDIIIPATDTPGASAAGVPMIVDSLTLKSERLKTSWTNALAFFEREAKAAGAERFVSLSKDKQIEIMRRASEAKPGSEAAGAFELLKNTTVDVYYSTRAGLVTELGWNANTFLPKFEGCTHKEHQA